MEKMIATMKLMSKNVKPSIGKMGIKMLTLKTFHRNLLMKMFQKLFQVFFFEYKLSD